MRTAGRWPPRRRVFAFSSIGRSEEGREILMVAVADENGIRDLDRLKAATASLADPRTTSPDAAEALIAAARPSITSTRACMPMKPDRRKQCWIGLSAGGF